MEKNRRFAELVGIVWNDTYRCEDDNDNPDFAADPRLVLREMVKREDWPMFCESLDYGLLQIFIVNYILDTTGKLRDAAIEWMKGKL